jgi:hypothetical protein
MASLSEFRSESAWAASAGESRYRIDGRIAPARNARVIALDERAAAIARRVADGPWAQARFFTCASGGDEAALRGLADGAPAVLAELLTDTDVVVVLATDDTGRAQAAAIGRACGTRAIMTAGVVLGDGFEADDAVAALRPHARVLLLSAAESDVFELLTALRV